MTKDIHILPFLLFALCATQLCGQTSMLHTSELVALHQAADGSILITDAQRKVLELQNQQMVVLDKPKAVAKVATPEYSLHEGRLRYHLDSTSFNIHSPPDSALALVPLDEGLLVSTTAGLYLFSNEQFRRYYQPGLEFPDSIISMSREADLLALLSGDGLAFVYDLNKQVLTPLAYTEKVTGIAWDKWNGLWSIAGKKIIKDHSFVNELGPDLIISHLGPLTIANSEKTVIPFTVRYALTGHVVRTYYRLSHSDSWKLCPLPDKLILEDLQPGRYTLQFRSEGLNSSSTISQPIKLQVKADDWLSKFWPWLAGVFGLLFLVAGWGQLRLRRELTRLSEEKNRISLQYEIKNQKQRVGQLQMNPHFLFNTLNSISGLIALNENKKARKYLNEFSQMMRNVLDGSRSETLTVAEEIKFLSHYLSLEKMCRNNSFDYELSADIDTEKVKLPALLIQPFVENAIVHGLRQNKSGGKLVINFSEERNYTKVTIEDNGIGREAASAFKAEGHNSAAIDIITQRIMTLDKWGQGGVVYEDLYDVRGEPSGTRVVVRVAKG